MTKEKHVMRAAVIALTIGLGIVGYRQTEARANGIPASTPMTYSGTLEEGGSPVTGSRNMELMLWDDATSTASSHLRCTTLAPNTPVQNGRFQVPLDNSCTAVIHSTPDLWLEVMVSGSSLGRTKVGAVPFAVEASRAADLTPAARNSLVPPGTVIAFGGSTTPKGWLLCDGSDVSRTKYASLFAAIGIAWGSGDGATTFALPDLRGRFLRGVDQGAGRDPDSAARTASAPGGNAGDAVGSVQLDMFKRHNHGGQTGPVDNQAGTDYYRDFACGGGSLKGYAYQAVGNCGASNPFLGHTHSIPWDGGNETRPKNAAVEYLVKY